MEDDRRKREGRSTNPFSQVSEYILNLITNKIKETEQKTNYFFIVFRSKHIGCCVLSTQEKMVFNSSSHYSKDNIKLNINSNTCTSNYFLKLFSNIILNDFFCFHEVLSSYSSITFKFTYSLL